MRSQRNFRLAAGLAAAMLAPSAMSQAHAQGAKSPALRVYIGTYTEGPSKGIYLAEFDPSTGTLTTPKAVGEVSNPSFLAVHPSRKFLYSVNEDASTAGKTGGAVSAFAVDPKTGALTLLNQESTKGAGPCHLVVDRTGKAVISANYGGGSVCSMPIGADGKVGPASTFIQHKGEVADPARQGGPHAHSANIDASNKYAFVADLGLDRIFVYKLDHETATLVPNDPPAAKVAPKSGPRHFAFHPGGEYAYVINEISNTVTAFKYDAAAGTLQEIQTVTTLPADFKGTSNTAEVQVHPSGKFVYGSNRGHDSIASFAVDQASGKLTPTGFQAEGIKTPRNFGVDPTGAFVLVANQAGDSISVFAVDQADGTLKPTGKSVAVPKPVCIKFVPVD
ncbi:lactonase family protein [Isosphaeraceae bacterium EP7]